MKNTDQIKNIPCVALRGLTVFPKILFHFDIGRERSVRAIEAAMEKNQQVFLVTQMDISEDTPKEETLFSVGTVCKVCQVLKIPGDTIRVLVEGVCRARLDAITDTEPCFNADITVIEDIPSPALSPRDFALMRRAKDMFMELSVEAQLPNEIFVTIADKENLGFVADYIAHYSQLSYDQKQILLTELSPRRRLYILVEFLANEMKIRSVEDEISEKVKTSMDKNERDYYLREQIKIINEELGDSEDGSSESQKYIEKIMTLGLDAESEEKLIKEAKKLVKMQPTSPESAVVRGYLDECTELPWNERRAENYDINRAKEILDEDHYGLEKVKERILEAFAVKNLTGKVTGNILCLVGPPGVGKTSVARSVARAMGRDFARLSLGGVRDEAEIRGHRKTYIGSMPGRIMNAVKQAKSKNCLILIDEVDKMSNDYKGDPSAALLEVFDTEQNNAFRDHFIELPFDLSEVFFITTANDREAIPAPLLDRMEIIELTGYTDSEKLNIAQNYIFKKQLAKNGLSPENISVSEDAFRALITDYTKESGVRNLERQIAKMCRKCAKEMSENRVSSVSFTKDNLEKYLGVPRYKNRSRGKNAECGVVCGLAWTSVGGELLETEVIAVEGKGKLEITGNLGDVMKESSKIALTYVRSIRSKLGLAKDFFTKHDFHLHFPEGAVPKDGPSAGITITTAMISAFCGIPVPKDIAMTGEVTLRGRVLAIGGLKEKTMAAYRDGVKTVLLPEENRPDLQDIDKTVRENIKFVFVSNMDEVISFIFGEKLKKPSVITEKSLPVQAFHTEKSKTVRIRQ